MDEHEIIIGERRFTDYVGFTVNHDIYDAAQEFTVDIKSSASYRDLYGKKIVIKSNGIVVFSGIVERFHDSGSKGERSRSISGRDYMGLVVDECIQRFYTLKNQKLINVAELYLRSIPAVRNSNITYMDGCEGLDVPQDYVQPRPGHTVFYLLSSIAASRGMHFYMRPDGNIVFGKPKGFGAHTYAAWRTNGGNCNFTGWNFSDDCSRRYSTVIVLGQRQSTPSVSVADINNSATATDALYPITYPKTLVIETDTAALTPKQQARMVVEQRRRDGWRLQYTMKGHSQHGYVWQPDTLCAVADNVLDITGEYLIYGRTLTSRKGHSSTTIILGKMADAV